jgi:iron(III) transport system permease protein
VISSSGTRPRRFSISGWLLTVMAIALLVALPVFTILGAFFGDSGEQWAQLASTVLPLYLRNSLWLSLGVSFGVLGIGVCAAWLVTLCRFPGHGIFEWALLLPLSAPAYVLAYTYTDFLDVTGPLQSWLRLVFDWEVGDYWFPNIRSLGGAIAMLTLVLYPYVYMLARVAFLEQSKQLIEASRVLGCTPWRSFWTLALPLARPSIVAGLSLVLMETLNDFGTVHYFSVDTFTTGIYRVWAGSGDRGAATQLAAVLLAFILGLLFLERRSRGKARYYQVAGQGTNGTYYSLEGLRAIAALIFCLIPVILGFLLPILLLVLMGVAHFHNTFDRRFWEYANHSFLLSCSAATIATVIAMTLGYGQRLTQSPWVRAATRLAAMGYAIPGSIIAVGIAIPFGALDGAINAGTQAIWGFRVGLVFSGTIPALIYAYLVRFLAVSFGTVEAGLAKVRPSLDEAARSLGRTPTQTLLSVHTPLMWSSVLTAVMLVFVDVMKELPATLMIRPFNFDTLAFRVYRLASDERLAESSGAALAIVAVGLLPVIVLSWQMVRSRQSS